MSSEDVLRKIEATEKLILKIRKWQQKFIKQIITKEGLENFTFTGPTEGKTRKRKQ